jgi:hypothetical protein
MTDVVAAALIAASASLLGGIITGGAALLISRSRHRTWELKRRLRTLAKSIVAFRQLEVRYTRALANGTQGEPRSAESWKRFIREAARRSGECPPSRSTYLSELRDLLDDATNESDDEYLPD